MGERCPCCGETDWRVVNYRDNPEDPRLYLRDCECACGHKWSDKPGEMIHSWKCLVAGGSQTIAALRSEVARLRDERDKWQAWVAEQPCDGCYALGDDCTNHAQAEMCFPCQARQALRGEEE